MPSKFKDNETNNLVCAQGERGKRGHEGPPGECGKRGPTGPRGKRGHKGDPGPMGPTGARGPTGMVGATGFIGPTGFTGSMGPTGMVGATGFTGMVGATGFTGMVGATGFTGMVGATGFTGMVGATGSMGPTGSASTNDFANFFALMPSDNAAPIAPGSDVAFPQNGPGSGTAITRISATSFNLGVVGTYSVSFQASITEAGQLDLTLNGFEQAYTVVGRDNGDTQLVGMALITTVVANSVLTVRNPSGNVGSLTLTTAAGGLQPVSAQLVIVRIA